MGMCRTLKVRPDPREWKAYTTYVSEIVIGGFAKGIIVSIDYLTQQLDAAATESGEGIPPLLEIQMALEKEHIKWKPDLEDGDDDSIGVRAMFKQWLKKFAPLTCLLGYWAHCLYIEWHTCTAMTRCQPTVGTTQVFGNG